MSEDDYKGIATILGVTPPNKTTGVATPKTPEDPLMEYIDKVIYMKPLELPKNVLKRDEYGYTPAQNKEIQDWYTKDDRGNSKGKFKEFVKTGTRRK